jgi:hypothetical protein
MRPKTKNLKFMCCVSPTGRKSKTVHFKPKRGQFEYMCGMGPAGSDVAAPKVFSDKLLCKKCLGRYIAKGGK